MAAEFWQWLAQLAPATWLQRSALAYLVVNAAHIAALAVLIGTIVTLDLRLLGLNRQVPLPVIAPFLSRMAGWGLGFAVLSGIWLFLVNAPIYVENVAFRLKLALIGAGLLNVLLLHRRRDWRRLADGPASFALRVHAALSLALWLGVLLAGRWIGFI